MTPELLKIQHLDNVNRAERLREAVVVQLSELLGSSELTLGVPIESRVKAWASIEGKLQRKKSEIENIFALQDFVGIRVILLFRSDLERAIELIRGTFEVVSSEDTATRLNESEFGYHSQHFVVRLPASWFSLPSLANLTDFVVELQVRTLAQHIWAAASHKLQYKQEAGVPPPLRRTINRISALLETVDLEFERVLDERRRYVAQTVSAPPENEPLNVDILASLLTELLPAENKKEEESYAALLSDLAALKVLTTQQLRHILMSHRKMVKKSDLEQVKTHKEDLASEEPEVVQRLARGVFYAHVGLVREALRFEFGKDIADSVFQSRVKPTRASKRAATTRLG